MDDDAGYLAMSVALAVEREFRTIVDFVRAGVLVQRRRVERDKGLLLC